MKKILATVLLTAIFITGYATAKENRVSSEKRKIVKQNRVAENKESTRIEKQNRLVDELKSNLEKAYPGLTIDNIEQSPMAGFYEMTSGSSVWYISADGRFVLTGDMWDISGPSSEQQNITENARRKFRLNAMKNFKEDNMIVYQAKADKVGSVIVLTDPDCGYCKRLHSEMEKLATLGVEMRYVSVPRQGVGSPGYTKMVNIWCSENKQAAMTKAMNGEDVKAELCAHPIEAQLAFGEKVGVTGTPAMLLEDGTLIMGYMSAESLLEKVKEHRVQP